MIAAESSARKVSDFAPIMELVAEAIKLPRFHAIVVILRQVLLKS